MQDTPEATRLAGGSEDVTPRVTFVMPFETVAISKDEVGAGVPVGDLPSGAAKRDESSVVSCARRASAGVETANECEKTKPLNKKGAARDY